MNPQLTSQLAARQARDLRHRQERHGNRLEYHREHHLEHREPPAADGRYRPASLRHAMGFRLVEAGLRLLASTAH